MPDHTDDHLHSLEKQSQVFVGGQIDRMKLRNADRENEAARKRSRERGDDLAREAENATMVPMFKKLIVQSSSPLDNAEDMTAELLLQSNAWRQSIQRWAQESGVDPDADKAHSIIQGCLEELRADASFSEELRQWIKANAFAGTPSRISLPRLASESVALPELSAAEASARASARQKHQIYEEEVFAQCRGPYAMARLLGIIQERRRWQENAEDMIFDLIMHSEAWLEALPLLANEWGIELDKERVSIVLGETLADNYSNQEFLAECRQWSEKNYKASEPSRITLPKLRKAPAPKA